MRMRARLPDLRRPGRQHRPAGQARRAAHPRPDSARSPPVALKFGRRMNLAERLRGVVRPAGRDQFDVDDRRGAPSGAPDAAETLGGEWRDGRYLVVDRTYHAGYRLGRVAVADCLPADDGRWPRLGLLMSGADGANAPDGRLLFLDLETTGLAGGAGTYAFLVGCGLVRQWGLSCPPVCPHQLCR